MSQTWQHHSSTISIIVQCLKSGFWVRKDTLDWGLVRAVGGSGNTSNVHQGTLPLSLSATCTITIKTTGKTGRPQNISSIRRNQLVPVQPTFLNFFDIYVHLRAHTLLSTSNRLERFPLFVKLFYNWETVKGGQFSTSISSVWVCVPK